MGSAGQLARVNHGYARNFLVPNRLAMPAAAGPHRSRRPPAAEAGSSASAAQQAAAAAERNSQAQLTVEKHQQQFDKLMKTLTGSTLVRGGTCPSCWATH